MLSFTNSFVRRQFPAFALASLAFSSLALHAEEVTDEDTDLRFAELLSGQKVLEPEQNSYIKILKQKYSAKPGFIAMLEAGIAYGQGNPGKGRERFNSIPVEDPYFQKAIAKWLDIAGEKVGEDEVRDLAGVAMAAEKYWKSPLAAKLKDTDADFNLIFEGMKIYHAKLKKDNPQEAKKLAEAWDKQFPKYTLIGDPIVETYNDFVAYINKVESDFFTKKVTKINSKELEDRLKEAANILANESPYKDWMESEKARVLALTGKEDEALKLLERREAAFKAMEEAMLTDKENAKIPKDQIYYSSPMGPFYYAKGAVLQIKAWRLINQGKMQEAIPLLFNMGDAKATTAMAATNYYLCVKNYKLAASRDNAAWRYQIELQPLTKKANRGKDLASLPGMETKDLFDAAYNQKLYEEALGLDDQIQKEFIAKKTDVNAIGLYYWLRATCAFESGKFELALEIRNLLKSKYPSAKNPKEPASKTYAEQCESMLNGKAKTLIKELEEAIAKKPDEAKKKDIARLQPFVIVADNAQTRLFAAMTSYLEFEALRSKKDPGAKAKAKETMDLFTNKLIKDPKYATSPEALIALYYTGELHAFGGDTAKAEETWKLYFIKESGLDIKGRFLKLCALSKVANQKFRLNQEDSLQASVDEYWKFRKDANNKWEELSADQVKNSVSMDGNIAAFPLEQSLKLLEAPRKLLVEKRRERNKISEDQKEAREAAAKVVRDLEREFQPKAKEVSEVIEKWCVTYPDADRVPHFRLKQGKLLLDAGDINNARSKFELLKSKFPTHEVTKAAAMAVVELHLEAGERGEGAREALAIDVKTLPEQTLLFLCRKFRFITKPDETVSPADKKSCCDLVIKVCEEFLSRPLADEAAKIQANGCKFEIARAQFYIGEEAKALTSFDAMLKENEAETDTKKKSPYVYDIRLMKAEIMVNTAKTIDEFNAAINELRKLKEEVGQLPAAFPNRNILAMTCQLFIGEAGFRAARALGAAAVPIIKLGNAECYNLYQPKSPVPQGMEADDWEHFQSEALFYQIMFNSYLNRAETAETQKKEFIKRFPTSPRRKFLNPLPQAL
ncbi:MAG: hypothetical protein RL095_184 [Verrucomicrobiota bacterium]|jgi:hypothetical protein